MNADTQVILTWYLYLPERNRTAKYKESKLETETFKVFQKLWKWD